VAAVDGDGNAIEGGEVDLGDETAPPWRVVDLKPVVEEDVDGKEGLKERE